MKITTIYFPNAFLGFFLLLMGACASHEPRSRSGSTTVAKKMLLPGEADENALADAKVAFDWPLRNPTVINFYGWRRRRMHEGVDLRAYTGTPVYSAAPGEVVYAGRKVRGYGQMITIRHAGGWNTVYAHLSKIKVRIGDNIRAGDFIAASGNTGRSRGPHLHFEIRRGSDPLDPLLYLPNAGPRASMLTRSF